MSATNKVSSGSVLYAMNSYRVVTEPVFYKQFSDVKSIGTEGKAYSEEKAITSFDIGDCITLFAIEKHEGGIKAIMGWHIGNGATVEDIKGDDYLNDFVIGNAPEEEEDDDSEGSEKMSESKEALERTYELYIIGGDKNTTQGTGCLLKNIHQAIGEFFFAGTFSIRQELVNLNSGTANKFVSANLQMDGTLTICLHKNRHY